MNVKDSIRKRLNKSLAMISLVCSIGLVICGISLFVISSQYHNALTNYGFAQGDIGKAMTTFSEARSSLRAVIGYTDMNEIADEQKKYETKKSAFEGYMADVEKTIVTKAGKDAYAQVESALNGYWTKADSILKQGATTDNGASGAAQKKEIEELSPMYDNVYAALKNIMDINVTKGDEVQNTLNVLMYILIVLVVAIIAFSVYMSTHLGRRIADNIEKPVEALAERLKKFAAGDLDSEFPESEIDDEIAYMNNVAKEMAADLNLIISDLSRLMDEMAAGNFKIKTDIEDKYVGKFVNLKDAIRNMNRKMDATLKSVDESSQQVTVGSENLAQSAQELAEGATEQAGAVEELQATIATLTEQIADTADNTYITPKSTSILPSITNKSLMQLAEDMGIKVERRPIPEEELETFEEAGACGTAAVISPIQRIDDLENGKSYVISKDGKPGPICTKLYNKLRGIQYGDEPDTHGWVTIVE